MQIYLFKPKNKVIEIENSRHITYLLDKNGAFIESDTNLPIFETLAKNCCYYIYAPFPVNILAIPHCIKHKITIISNHKLDYITICILLFWLRLERYLSGSDTYSRLMRKILIEKFDRQSNDMYFIPITTWISSLKQVKRSFNQWITKIPSKTPL